MDPRVILGSMTFLWLPKTALKLIMVIFPSSFQ